MTELETRAVLGIANGCHQHFSKSKVLVTGGAGFLGSWLCDILVAAEASVDLLDNFSTGRQENIKHLKRSVNVIRKDVASAQLRGSYDFVFHLSSRASPEEYQMHQVETLMANSLGTLRMLEVARKLGSVFVYSSTSEIYGDAKIVPTPETYLGNVSSIGVRSCYDEGKRFGEALSMAYYRQHGTRIRIARIFNSYGPRIRGDGIYARVVPRFINQALKNDPITIYDDGLQTRSFCYVTDTIEGLLCLATTKGIDGEVFNIGNPHELTILELAQTIKRITGSRSELVFVKGREDDPRRRAPETSKSRKRLGWTTKVDLESGLRRTLQSLVEGSVDS